MEKYALVTGADHGVGLSLTENLLERGYTVVAGQFNEGETELKKLQEKYLGKLHIVSLNISLDESVRNMKATVEKLIPHIDLLINNAGILGDMQKTWVDDLDYEEITRVINVNAVGPLRVSSALSELIIKGNDKTIVNISSEAGSITDCFREGWFGYGMSKAANNMQSALIHNSLKQLGGRVIAMHPGHVATYMRGHLDTTAKITPQVSAAGILKTVLDTELPVEERPLYLDYQGKRLPW